MPIEGPYGCKLAADLGLEGIQLELGSYEKNFPLSKKSVQEAYLEAAEKYNITYPSIAVRVTDDYSITDSKESKSRKIIMEAVEKGIDTAKAMNIPVVMIPTFEKSEIRTASDFQKVVEVFKHICDYGLEKGITIAAENVLSVAQTLDLFEKVDKPNLQLYFDTQNYYLNKGYETPKMIKDLIPLFCNQLHVKDGKGKDLSGALLGEGDTDFYESIKELKKHRYSGWYIIENYYNQKPLSSLHDDPVEILKKDVGILKEAIKNY